MTLAALLFDSGAPGDVVVHTEAGDVTRAQLVESAEALAKALRSLGVGPGNAVAVALPNSAALVAALFGVWRAGAVYVPLNPMATERERTRIVDLVKPAALIDGHDGSQYSLRALHDRAMLGSDVALVQFTSGTTGPPQPVPLEHANVLHLLDSVIASLRGRARTKERTGTPMPNLVPVSLSLWAGIYQVLFAFRNGAGVILMSRFEPVTFADLVARYQIRSVVLPPAAMTMLSDTPEVTTLSPLRYVRSITAPLSPLQARRFVERFGIGVLNCYGQTELGGEIVGWTAADWERFGATKLGAVGRPHAGVEVRALEGELVVRTPALVEAPRSFADRMTDDGWFRTGDLGTVDEDGFVWIDGRVSEMVNRGGLKVFPAEVEEVLRLDPGISDVAVVGVPDDRLGQVPWAFVVSAPGNAINPTALEALCREHLAPYKIPVRFEQVDALPRNAIGKVLARELAERATRAI